MFVRFPLRFRISHTHFECIQSTQTRLEIVDVVDVSTTRVACFMHTISEAVRCANVYSEASNINAHGVQSLRLLRRTHFVSAAVL